MVWVNKHHDSEDEGVGVGMTWDGRTQPLETKAWTEVRNREPTRTSTS